MTIERAEAEAIQKRGVHGGARRGGGTWSIQRAEGESEGKDEEGGEVVDG